MAEATATARMPRSRENTRARLLHAAFEVFAEVGLDAASVEAVCERAGFTRGAFYSNFDSKDELFLELAAQVSDQRVQSVRQRVAALTDAAADAFGPASVPAILEELLDISADDRLGVLLMAEIRIRALRDPDVAHALEEQDVEMQRNVAQIIDDIGGTKGMAFRVDATQAARLMLTVWEGAAVRAVMRGLSDGQLRQQIGEELAQVAQLIIAP
jgi:AcrR family transcriptional regulator